MNLLVLTYGFAEKLKIKIKKIEKKDKKRIEILYKKIKQIINSNEKEINHFKNLKYGLNDLKRVHIDKRFVLTFQYFKKEKFIKFIDFEHHDKIYV